MPAATWCGAWYLERDLDGTLAESPPPPFERESLQLSLHLHPLFFHGPRPFQTKRVRRSIGIIISPFFPFPFPLGSMLRENGPFRLIVNYNKQTVSRIENGG